MLLQLNITPSYLARFRSLLPSEKLEDSSTFLNVRSTRWMDLSQRSGRFNYVKHIVALINMADAYREQLG
jgi:hypothetical protein